MNYLAHGWLHVDDPYFLAGTAIPDWLNVVDRRVRVRRKQAAPYCASDDPRLATIARGVVRHHEDDAWFHATPAFAELSLRFTVAVRDALAPDEGLRPSFLGHILVELLLDDVLAAEAPERLEAYYAALDQLDPAVVQAAVNQMSARPTDRLTELLPLFVRERFLYDYAEDGKLRRRLNQVMRRVGLPELPERFESVLPAARRAVCARAAELLAPPPDEGRRGG